MRLIDADALIAQMEADAEQMKMTVFKMATYAAINDVKHQPTIEERKTGRWVDDGKSLFFGGMRHYLPMICSCCGRSALNEPWHYCPNCGAKMEGGDEWMN